MQVTTTNPRKQKGLGATSKSLLEELKEVGDGAVELLELPLHDPNLAFRSHDASLEFVRALELRKAI